MIYKLFGKNSAVRVQSETLATWVTQATQHKSAFGGAVNSGIMSNQELAEKLHKQVILKLESEKYTHLLKTIFGVLVLPMCN